MLPPRSRWLLVQELVPSHPDLWGNEWVWLVKCRSCTFRAWICERGKSFSSPHCKCVTKHPQSKAATPPVTWPYAQSINWRKTSIRASVIYFCSPQVKNDIGWCQALAFQHQPGVAHVLAPFDKSINLPYNFPSCFYDQLTHPQQSTVLEAGYMLPGANSESGRSGHSNYLSQSFPSTQPSSLFFFARSKEIEDKKKQASTRVR